MTAAPRPCECRTSTCRNFATISSGLYRFLAIAVLLDLKDIPQVGPLQWGRISLAVLRCAILQFFPHRPDPGILYAPQIIVKNFIDAFRLKPAEPCLRS